MVFFGKYYNEPITVLFYVFKYVIISGSNWVSFTGLLLCKSPGKKGFFFYFYFLHKQVQATKIKKMMDSLFTLMGKHGCTFSHVFKQSTSDPSVLVL